MNVSDEHFSLFDFEDEDGRQCYALIDTQLKFFKDKSSYPTLLWVEAHYKDMDLDQRPTKEEAEALEEAEQLIFKKLGKTCRFLFAGRTTLPKLREIILYVDDATQAQVAINRLVHDFTDRRITFDLESDPEWEGIAGFLEG